MITQVFCIHQSNLEFYDINNIYEFFWPYSVVALVYTPVFLYMLMQRTNQLTNSIVIVRFKKKTEILAIQACENLIQAIEMVIITNTFVIIYMILVLNVNMMNDSCIYMLLCNIPAQIFSWLLIGYIYIFVVNITEKYVSSYITTILVICFIFYAQSGTFVFRKFFFDIHSHMLINTAEMNASRIIITIIQSLIGCCILYLASLVTIIKKKMFGVEIKYETNS